MTEDHKKKKGHKHASHKHVSSEGPGKHKKHHRKSAFSQQYYPSDSVTSGGLPFQEYTPTPSISSMAPVNDLTYGQPAADKLPDTKPNDLIATIPPIPETTTTTENNAPKKTAGDALTAAGLGALGGAMFGPAGAGIGALGGVASFYADEIAKGIDTAAKAIDTAVKNDPGLQERTKKDVEYQKDAGVTADDQVVAWGGM